MKTLKDIGEIQTLEQILKMLPSRQDILHGAGDDCAVVKVEGSSRDWLLTSDPVIEGTHFTAQTPARMAGRKSVGRVLSDLAAMGGEPCWALINAVAPPETPVSWLEDAYRGALELAAKHGLAMVGGDLSRGPVKELHVFAIGRTPAGSCVLRSGAKPGDGVYVTGELGGAGRGKHLCFEPRVAEGAWLRTRGWATAMIDLSDGLARDLKRLCRMSRTGAELKLADVPVSREAETFNDDRTPVEHALYDGEDFELLFTVPEDREDAFRNAWSNAFELACRRIGRITDVPGHVQAVDSNGSEQELADGDFNHFA